jgi:osmotically-inducible protein OsmY
MNAKLIHYAGALLGSAACALAVAQQPVASPWTTTGPPAENLNAVVQALNADASLQNMKITVQPDGENVLLTGVAPTLEQSQKAAEIATGAAGGAIVVNAIRPEKTKYDMPAYELQPSAEPAKQ